MKRVARVFFRGKACKPEVKFEPEPLFTLEQIKKCLCAGIFLIQILVDAAVRNLNFSILDQL